jgi:hypothetical protein
MVGPRPITHDGSMMIIVVAAVLGILSIAGAVAAGMDAASPELATERRLALSILAGLLTLLGLCMAFLVYWFSAFIGALR